MTYDFYLDKCLLPVAPEKLTVKVNSANKTLNLLNEGQVSIIKKPELTDIEFDFLLPASPYPFARYTGGFNPPKFYLDKLNELKNSGKPFQFIAIRTGENSTNITVTLEDYRITENANSLFDILVNIKLKEYREFKNKIIKIETDNPFSERTPSTTQNVPIGIGSEVIVNGRLFKNSYGAEPGRTLTSYHGKINYINMKGSHPYHITTLQGGWLGWVLADAVKAVT